MAAIVETTYNKKRVFLNEQSGQTHPTIIGIILDKKNNVVAKISGITPELSLGRADNGEVIDVVDRDTKKRFRLFTQPIDPQPLRDLLGYADAQDDTNREEMQREGLYMDRGLRAYLYRNPPREETVGVTK